jgi:hypothetical protein
MGEAELPKDRDDILVKMYALRAIDRLKNQCRIGSFDIFHWNGLQIVVLGFYLSLS